MQSPKDLISSNTLYAALANLILGLLMLVFGSGSISLLFYISGIVFILLGIIQIVTKSADIKAGVITILVGVILAIIGYFGDIANILVGLILVLSALPSLVGASSSLGSKFGVQSVDFGNATINKVITVILLIVGVCLIAAFAIGELGGIADILIRVGGVILLLVGLLGLIGTFKN